MPALSFEEACKALREGRTDVQIRRRAPCGHVPYTWVPFAGCGAFDVKDWLAGLPDYEFRATPKPGVIAEELAKRGGGSPGEGTFAREMVKRALRDASDATYKSGVTLSAWRAVNDVLSKLETEFCGEGEP